MGADPQAGFQSIYATRENPNDEFVVIVEWLVLDKVRVSKNELFVVLETSKALLEVESPGDGVLRHNLDVGAKVAIGDVIAYLCVDEAIVPPFVSSIIKSAARITDASVSSKISAKALKLIKALNLSESEFDDFQEVRERDVLDLAARLDRNTTKGSSNSGSDTEADSSRIAPTSTKMFEIANLAKATANQFASQVVWTFNINVLKERVRSMVGDVAASVTPGEYIVYAASRVLSRYPEFNSYFSEGAVQQYGSVNIGYALNLGKGLRVPVLLQAHDSTLLEISYGIKELAMKYLRNELTASNYSSATITVTDLFSFGVYLFDPVINFKQGAILGLCSPQFGSPLFQVVLKFDHRLSDGVRAAMFLKELEGV